MATAYSAPYQQAYAAAAKSSVSSRHDDSSIPRNKTTRTSPAMLCIAILCPPVPVFRIYGCSDELAFCVVLTILGFIPGIVYAILVVRQEAFKGYAGSGYQGYSAYDNNHGTVSATRKPSLPGYRADGRRPSTSTSAFGPLPGGRRPSMSPTPASPLGRRPSNFSGNKSLTNTLGGSSLPRRGSVARSAKPPTAGGSHSSSGPGLDPILEDVQMTESEDDSFMDEEDDDTVVNAATTPSQSVVAFAGGSRVWGSVDGIHVKTMPTTPPPVLK